MNETNNQIKEKWILLDAENKVLGRLASKIAIYLMGKNTIEYKRNVVSGYNIIVINAKKLIFTGKKINNKVYYRHSGYPGGFKKTLLKDLVEKNIQFVIKNAVKGMLPKNKLQKIMLKRLRIFSTSTHIHEAQKPEKIEI
ncbi:50S ribosomal protein L13 [Candidatus Azoamicus ciliaticola]|uniref:Large ribosomal subunit protein uL13 n=1 Tax=Candidatus Azoamicus ciliaticola TaxID=2652803 RepID=A0A6J5JWF6_9GAMM|nr:50S ribosomal protein L13 [Candidatus Azoamicus ciliaticola]CAB3976354.1 50S ribosomal protein L13 [Candidatus Azoamicus ciliaticola]